MLSHRIGLVDWSAHPLSLREGVASAGFHDEEEGALGMSGWFRDAQRNTDFDVALATADAFGDSAVSYSRPGLRSCDAGTSGSSTWC